MLPTAILRYLAGAIILQEQMTLIQIFGGALLLGSTFVSEIRSVTFSKLRMKSLSTNGERIITKTGAK
jgi:drug/metabolite transporter (DMT)-like permease